MNFLLGLFRGGKAAKTALDKLSADLTLKLSAQSYFIN